MDYRLRHPPWTGEGLIPEDVFIRRVNAALDADGYWETYAEYRMGAGPTVSITVMSSGDKKVYRAVCKWMRWAFQLSGDYDDLDAALQALPLFGDAMFGVLSAGGSKGLVDSD
jgi:hypothetical protein